MYVPIAIFIFNSIDITIFFHILLICCKCGSINHDLDLSDRQYICDCGNNLNRDINGAINIYKQFMGDYNPPFETLVVSERFDWCHINQMNKNYKFYN